MQTTDPFLAGYLPARAESLREYIREDEAAGKNPERLREELAAIEARMAALGIAVTP